MHHRFSIRKSAARADVSTVRRPVGRVKRKLHAADRFQTTAIATKILQAPPGRGSYWHSYHYVRFNHPTDLRLGGSFSDDARQLAHHQRDGIISGNPQQVIFRNNALFRQSSNSNRAAGEQQWCNHLFCRCSRQHTQRTDTSLRRDQLVSRAQQFLLRHYPDPEAAKHSRQQSNGGSAGQTLRSLRSSTWRIRSRLRETDSRETVQLTSHGAFLDSRQKSRSKPKKKNRGGLKRGMIHLCDV